MSTWPSFEYTLGVGAASTTDTGTTKKGKKHPIGFTKSTKKGKKK